MRGEVSDCSGGVGRGFCVPILPKSPKWSGFLGWREEAGIPPELRARFGQKQSELVSSKSSNEIHFAEDALHGASHFLQNQVSGFVTFEGHSRV